MSIYFHIIMVYIGKIWGCEIFNNRISTTFTNEVLKRDGNSALTYLYKMRKMNECKFF